MDSPASETVGVWSPRSFLFLFSLREFPNYTILGTRTGTLWGYVGDEDRALYLYASTGKKRGQREGELGPEDVLAMREGYVVADAAGVFDESFKRPSLIECGCNMHSRTTDDLGTTAESRRGGARDRAASQDLGASTPPTRSVVVVLGPTH